MSLKFYYVLELGPFLKELLEKKHVDMKLNDAIDF